MFSNVHVSQIEDAALDVDNFHTITDVWKHHRVTFNWLVMLLEQFSSSWVAVRVAFSDLFNHWNRFKLMTTGHYIVKLQLAQYELHMTQGAKINATLRLICHGTQWGRTYFKCCKLLKGNKFSAVVTILRFFPAVLHFGEWLSPLLSGCWLLQEEGFMCVNPTKAGCC